MRLKLPGADRSKGSGVFAPWQARTIVQLHGAGRASRPQLKRDPLGSTAVKPMNLLGWLLCLGGLFGLIATRLGWYNDGGVMRRLDWFNVYGILERSWIGGGVRRINYAIFSTLLALGILEILLSFFRRS